MEKKLHNAIIVLVCLLGILIIVFYVLLCGSPAHAGEMNDVLIGAFVGSFIHEASHKYFSDHGEISFSGSITNPSWEYNGKTGTYYIENNNGVPLKKYYDFGEYKNNLEIVAKGGMIGEDMISHWLMDKRFRNRRLQNLRKGFVLRNILNNAYYLTCSANRGDLNPENFSSEQHRRRFKRIITADTALLTLEFVMKRSLLPRGTSISFKKHTIMLTKNWSF